MITYRLIYDEVEEIVFGIANPDKNKSLEKLKKGIKSICPYKEVVAHYKNDKFAFQSFNAFKYFLFGLCKLDLNDIKELEKLGFRVTVQELRVYMRGLSKILCTYFDDEVVEPINLVLLSELFENADSMDYIEVERPPVPKEFIKDCKDQYYKNVKFIK